ncbi:MAG: hypothetical protein ACJAZW_000609 [Maritalea sp.]|jgi:hypothetical protein
MSTDWPRWNSALVYWSRGWPFIGAILQKNLSYQTAKLPHFEDQKLTEWFADRLANANSYLEFGSGGTTFLAGQLGIPFASKESDLLFSLSVQQTLQQAGYLKANQQHIHADIGLTGNWGYPVKVNGLSRREKTRFAAYSDMPRMDKLPDLILIDGRFRVACALKCITALFGTAGWTILVDDYINRPHYHVVEQFAQLDQMVGRMAVFVPYPDVKMAAIEDVLSDHLYDCR